MECFFVNAPIKKKEKKKSLGDGFLVHRVVRTCFQIEGKTVLFSKKRDHPVESRYPPVWLWGRVYFPLCYYGAGRQASECDPALHQPVCVSFAPYSSTPPPATFAPLPYSIHDSFFGS